MAYVFPTPAAAPKNTFSLPRRRRASSSWTRTRSASGSGRASTARSVAPALREASTPPQDLRAYQHVILDTSAPGNRAGHRHHACPLGLTGDQALELEDPVVSASVNAPPRKPGLLLHAFVHLPNELVVRYRLFAGFRSPRRLVDHGGPSHDSNEDACLDDGQQTDVVGVHEGGRRADRCVGFDRGRRRRHDVATVVPTALR